MNEDFFVFNNINSLEMGVVVTKLPPISMENDKVSKTSVPGRRDLINIEKETREGTIMDVECYIFLEEKMNLIDTQAIFKWLNGVHDLIFSNNTEVVYKAYINNKVALEEIVRGGLIKFTLSFYCLPYPKLNGEYLREIKNGETIMNDGIESYPILKITGTGDITVKINNQIAKIKAIDKFIIIDNDLELIYKEKDDNEGHRVEMADFLSLAEGRNAISWIGNVTKFEINYNRRYL